jgi:hypothetical protein
MCTVGIRLESPFTVNSLSLSSSQSTESNNPSTLPTRLSYLLFYFLHLFLVIAHSFRQEEHPNNSLNLIHPFIQPVQINNVYHHDEDRHGRSDGWRCPGQAPQHGSQLDQHRFLHHSHQAYLYRQLHDAGIYLEQQQQQW